MALTTKQRNAKRKARETPTAPVVYRDDKGWRVDLPDGDFCYQPSHQFAISYARYWIAKDRDPFDPDRFAKMEQE